MKQFLSHVLRKELGINTLSSINKKHKVQVKDERETNEKQKVMLSYKKSQQFLELKKLLGDFCTIIDVLKINKIEQSKASAPVHSGKNIHELVVDIRDQFAELAGYKQSDERFARIMQDVTLKIGSLWQTKQMNPPYYFSFEF